MKIMKDMKNGIVESSEKSYSLLQELVNQGKGKERKCAELVEEMAKCQSLAIECGAGEESIESVGLVKRVLSILWPLS